MSISPALLPIWQVVSCHLPLPAHRVDAFLTGSLGPLMSRLIELGELGDWCFQRPGPERLDVYVRAADTALLYARMAGLTATVRGTEGRAAHLARPRMIVDLSVRNGHEHELTAIAVDVIRTTREHTARLGAALDLALAATAVVCPDGPVARRCALVPAHRREPDGRDANDSPTLTVSRTYLSPAMDRRCATIARRLTDAADPLARLARFLRADSSAGKDDPLLVLHRLHNRLGLNSGDEHRLYGALLHSLSTAEGARRPVTEPRHHPCARARAASGQRRPSAE